MTFPSILRQGISKKIILGFAALASAALIGTVGMAGASPHNNKPSKHDCKKAGYGNYGQCVKDWAHKKKYGYGGHGQDHGNKHHGNNHNNIKEGDSNINANIDVSGNHNVVSVVINVVRNYFFG